LERNRHDVRSLFYAESWALVHFLISADDGRRLPQLGQFISMVGRGVPTDEAFGKAFQTEPEAMEKELQKYIQGHTFMGRVATFERKLEFDSQMTAAPVGEAEAEGYLGDLLLHINRADDAASYLEHALALDPSLVSARASLGMARLRQRRFADAVGELRKAVAAGAQNYLAHYYLAYALSRDGMSDGGVASHYTPESVREMREALDKAIRLRPDFPESYHLLAFVDLVTGEQVEEGVRLIQKARALAPGNEHYALVLAQLYLRQEKFDEARRAAEPLARETAEPATRALAQSVLASIKNYEEQLARFKAEREAYEKAASGARENNNGGGPPPRLKRRDEPGAKAVEVTADSGAAATGRPGDERSVEEQVAQAFSDMLNDALRKPLEGETRLLATLTRIDCGPKGLVFVFKAGERTLRLTSADFKGLHIISYTPEAAGEITCGPRKREAPAVVTFRPSSDARAKTDGALVALEFVPANFQLKQ
jgi:tetratricopeptide (TPR) repeat protein